MSGFRRSRWVRLQVWFREHVLRFFYPRWLKQFFKSIAAGLKKFQASLRKVLLPRWLLQSFSSAGERLKKAETKVARTSEKVGKKVARSAVGEGARQLSRSGKRLEFRLTTFFVEASKFMGTILGGLVPTPVKNLFRWMGRQFWNVFGVFFVFMGRWFRTRHYWHLLGGIPAFLLALPLAYCMIRMPFYTAASKAKHYRAAAYDAMVDKDFETANLYYRKLYQLGAMNEAVEFQAALNTIERGDEAEGREQIARLAPDDQPGFPPAHAWIVRWHLNQNKQQLDETTSTLIEKHLQFALDRDPSNLEARALRAAYLDRIGRRQDAADELKAVVALVPETGLQLAGVYARQGRYEQARDAVNNVMDALQQRADTGKDLSTYEYLAWSHAYQILGELDQAEQKLQEGLKNHPNDPILTEPLSSLLKTVAMTAYRNGAANPSMIADKLAQAASLKPDDTSPLVMLADMSAQPTHVQTEIRQSIEALLASSAAPPKLFAVYAAQLAAAGDTAQAIGYLRRAIEIDPQDSYSLNNLAYCLFAEGTQHDAEALTLVDQALAVEPDQAMYLETRGQILLRLGRIDDAIHDLTSALNGLGDSVEIHAALAEAYEKQGNLEQAQIHRRRAS